MNRYEEKLQLLLQEEFNTVKSTTNPINLIGKIIAQRCTNKKFAIWGAGEHTLQLHKYFSVEIKDVLAIVDNDKLLQGSKVFGVKIISPKELINREIETILISSYSGAKAIEKNIKELNKVFNKKYEIINLYEILESQGVTLNGMFYANPSIYTEIYNTIEKYKWVEKREEKENTLEKIIYLYLEIRDFKNALNYLDLYIKNNFTKKNQLDKLQKNIIKLIESIKKQLQTRQNKDISLLFFDSLRAKDLFETNSPLKHISNMLETSICFTLAYSTSIFTYEAITSMFTCGLPFEEKLYMNRNLKKDQVKFITNAISKGYKINIYTMPQWDIIQGEGIEQHESNYISKMLWELACEMCEEKRNTLNILYIWQETHPPHMGGKHSIMPKAHVTPFTCNEVIEQTQQEYTKQYEEALVYVDEQTGFYLDLLPQTGYKVIFSDHGQIIEQALVDMKEIGTLAGWHTQRYHVPFIITGGNIKKRLITKLYSMQDFGNVINNLVGGKVAFTDSAYAEVQFPAIHNAVIIDKYKQNGLEDFLYGFRVLIDETYKLVQTGNNKIFIYNLLDEEKEINEENERKYAIKHFLKKGLNINAGNLGV